MSNAPVLELPGGLGEMTSADIYWLGVKHGREAERGRAPVEHPRLKAAGAKWWVTAEGNSPNLSRTSLGEFFVAALKSGAQIGSIWPFAPQYARSAVFVTVLMTDVQKAEIEETTGVRFREPDRPHVNAA